jgi:ABC-type dipeptide/oligopeptide/nickel transport system permease subunit
MLSAAKPYMRQRPLMAIAPGLAILITTLAIHLVGDAIGDALEPGVGRMKAEG